MERCHCPPIFNKPGGSAEARPEDQAHYQSQWALEWGSLAAPTASLHFRASDLESLGHQVLKICLHVGLGTFLPIQTPDIQGHKIHGERVMIPVKVWKQIQESQKQGGRIWALGSTVTRALESMALGLLDHEGEHYKGLTHLFIKPGFEYQVVDVLMTNFHQPKSSLLAMVMAFSGIEEVKRNYAWAIERQFRLFSYGDLSLWMK